MPRERIVVAMSGGVDSSVAAGLLREQGLDVVGVTLRLYDAKGTSASIGGRCCGPRDIEDARAAAAILGIPHYVLDESEVFRRVVVGDFLAEHRAGRTPNPCVRCNQSLKFGPLLELGRAIGADTMATGHYARLSPGADGSPSLRRAADPAKDQSYFLFAVPPAFLRAARFPLGEWSKGEVREAARRLRLPNAGKPDSQQICFIPDGDHRAFLEARGAAGPAGELVDEEGRRLGDHEGIHRFTVGQRRGVPAAGGARRFVLHVDASSGRVVAGPRSRLGRRRLRVSSVCWLGGQPPRRCQVQIRHRAPAHGARIELDPGGAVVVDLDEPACGVAPGQAAVFYDGDRVLGGGWIEDEPLGPREPVL